MELILRLENKMKKFNRHISFILFCTALILGGLGQAHAFFGVVRKPPKFILSFNFPANFPGQENYITSLVQRFEKENPEIRVKVNPIFPKPPKNAFNVASEVFLEDVKSGHPPSIVALSASDLFELTDLDIVANLNQFIKTDDDKAWLNAFDPNLMRNSKIKDRIYSAPLVRGVGVMMWNKKLFKEAGLDPNVPPKTLNELVEFGKKLIVKNEKGEVVQWGFELYSDSNLRYSLLLLASGNGSVTTFNSLGNKTNYAAPRVIDALETWYNFSATDKIMPPGIIPSATLNKDFTDQKTAIIWQSSGAIIGIKKSASFPVGVGTIPGKTNMTGVISGSNLYISKDQPLDKQKAAFKFIQWITQAEISADILINNGAGLARPDGKSADYFKANIANFPEANIIIDSLKVAVPEVTLHKQQAGLELETPYLQSVIKGEVPAKKALNELQVKYEELLKDFN